MKQILVGFAEKIDIINMNNIPMQHTIRTNEEIRISYSKRLLSSSKNADLYMDKF